MRDCGTSPSDPKPAASTLKEDCSLLPLVGFERARTHACRVVALLDPEEIDVAVVIQLLFPEHPWACVCHLLKQWAKIRGVIGRRGLADLGRRPSMRRVRWRMQIIRCVKRHQGTGCQNSV